MDKKEVVIALKKAKEISQKRNFKQTVDLIINLKDLDLKKPDHQLNLFVLFHYGIGKKISVCGLVGPELLDQSKQVFENTILVDDFGEYAKDPKKAKKLASQFNYFVAQANIMPKVAAAFGRVLGTRGKMPNPKAGCVVPPGANLKPLHEKLQKTAKVIAKTALMVQCSVGNEDSPDEEIIDNIMSIYSNVIHHLPNEENNIRSILLKLTMGPAVVIGKKSSVGKKLEAAKQEKKAAAKKEEKPEEAKKIETKKTQKKVE